MPQPMRMPVRCACLLVAAALTQPPLTVRAQDKAEDELGRQVFMTAEPPCAVCHALADAGAAGTIGPDLDALMPTEDRVRAAVTGGVGIMPAYDGTLTEEQVAAVSEYVARVAGQAE